MTTPIHHVGQLAGAIRAQLANRGSQTARPAERSRTPARSSTSGDTLARLIDLRVAQISPNDPNRGRKAFRIFLEAVLLSELGEQLVSDARFHQLVDDVQQAMQGDPDLALMIDQAIASLLAGGD